MTVTAVATAEPPAEQHAPWCSGGCPRWIAADAPSCLGYPCRCADTKANAPDWRKAQGDVRCWWKKKSGAVTSRCPCWNGKRDGRPGDCCSHHSANVLYMDVAAAVTGSTPIEGSPQPDDEAGAEMLAEPANLPPRPDVGDLWWDDDRPWESERPQHKPFVRRWPPEALSCTCNPKTLPKGVHCGQCCRTFGTEMAASMHRAGSRCRNPVYVRDVDSGAALLELDGNGVWRIHWHTHPGCCETWNLSAR